MSIAQYWLERLNAQNPLYNEKLRVDRVNVRMHPGEDHNSFWPRAVARQVLYQDYTSWHDEVFLKNYRESAYWSERLPNPAVELHFYTTLSPWVYIVDKDKQVRNYKVPAKLQYEDEWYEGRKGRNFIRLCEWKHHVAAFELDTGLTVADSPYQTFDDRVRELAVGRAEYNQRIDERRTLMEHNMGRGDADDEEA